MNTSSLLAPATYGLKAKGMPAQAQRARVDEMLGMIGMAGKGNKNASLLSGGEQQRVALVRALAPSPDMLLLDEPLSALDEKIRRERPLERSGARAFRHGAEAGLGRHRVAPGFGFAGSRSHKPRPCDPLWRPAPGRPRPPACRCSCGRRWKKSCTRARPSATACGWRTASASSRQRRRAERNPGQALALGVDPERVVMLED